VQASKLAQSLVVGVAVVGCTALAPRRALASEVFPGAIQEAANMQCVPICTLCHTTNPGNATSWQTKKLPLALKAHGVVARDADSLKKAWAAYLADTNPATADPTVRQLIVDQVKAGKDQTGADICGPSYGCGAHIATKAPPSNLSAPLWVVGAIAVGGFLRRRKREAPPQSR
jgi:hypothetical protein